MKTRSWVQTANLGGDPVSTSSWGMAAIKRESSNQLPPWVTRGQSYWELWEQGYSAWGRTVLGNLSTNSMGHWLRAALGKQGYSLPRASCLPWTKAKWAPGPWEPTQVMSCRYWQLEVSESLHSQKVRAEEVLGLGWGRAGDTRVFSLSGPYILWTVDVNLAWRM